MGGGGPTRIVEQTTTSPALTISPELRPLISQSVQQATEGQRQLPLTSFFGPTVQAIPGPTPQEVALINALLGVAERPTTPAQAIGAEGLTRLLREPLTGLDRMALEEAGLWLGSPLGESPATKAGMEAWKKLVEPTIRSEHAFRGTLGGGGFLEDLSLGATSAALPLIQQELQQRAALMPFLTGVGERATRVQQEAIQSLLEFGGREFEQIIGAILAAMPAVALPRELTGQQLQAVFEDFRRRQALSEAVGLGPLGQMLPTALAPSQVFSGQTRQAGGGWFGK